MTIPTDDRITSQVGINEYHADRGSLSASGAKLLLPPSTPRKFRERMDTPQEPKAAFDFGHVAHELVLGEGGGIEVLDPAVHGLKKDGAIADNPAATTTWKQAAAKARVEGKTPVHVDDYLKAVRMASAVKSHPTAGPFFEHGKAEKSIYWTDPETGVRLRCRPDWITSAEFAGRERSVVIDYKTGVDANPETWGRAAHNWGYELQFAWYVAGFQAVMGVTPVFLFVCQEKTPPHDLSVIELDGEAYGLGVDEMREAIHTFAVCNEADEWPGYPLGIQSVSLPPWAFRRSDVLTMADVDLTSTSPIEGVTA